MRRPTIPVENVAEIGWGILLVAYLVTAGRPEYRLLPVAVVFGASAAAALLDLYLRYRRWPGVLVYDSAVWSLLIPAMVAVTGGRSSEAWPAYLLMALTAPSLGRPVSHYGLMGLAALTYGGVYTLVNPYGAPFDGGLLLLRVGLFFLVTYVVDLAMARERRAIQDRVSELVAARDAERRRVAGEIHDWLGAGIIAPIRKLESALRAPEHREQTAQAIGMLQRSHQELRRVMEALHPHLLEQMGLVEALRAYLTDWGQEQSIATRFSAQSGPEPPAAVALGVYRILQEALNNAARHAGASLVSVSVQAGPSGIALTVTDDGTGFSPGRAPGRGLPGMAERAEALGGQLAVASRVGGGTVIKAEIPVTMAKCP